LLINTGVINRIISVFAFLAAMWVKDIFLVPSKSHQKDIGLENYSRTILTYDGEVVPQEQWDDVCSINRDEIASVETYSRNGKNRIVFLSKP